VSRTALGGKREDFKAQNKKKSAPKADFLLRVYKYIKLAGADQING
jgi:hypothetical protein